MFRTMFLNFSHMFGSSVPKKWRTYFIIFAIFFFQETYLYKANLLWAKNMIKVMNFLWTFIVVLLSSHEVVLAETTSTQYHCRRSMGNQMVATVIVGILLPKGRFWGWVVFEGEICENGRVVMEVSALINPNSWCSGVWV